MLDSIRWIIIFILGISIILYLLLTGLFKLYFPFWSRQPVFHLHNVFFWIYYYFNKDGNVISERLPDDSKFYDETIHFYNVKDCPENLKKDFVSLLERILCREKLKNMLLRIMLLWILLRNITVPLLYP